MKVEGAGGIWAEIVQDSKSIYGDRVTTFRLHYPRFIHSEFMTHRMVSKNASSSRAIPVNKQLDSIKNQPAMPIHWGLNQAGMQATTEGCEHSGRDLWCKAADEAVSFADSMWDDGKGFHKQIVNRLTEPFTYMNVVATATDWENFFWLRYHKDAQPEICELARVMFEAREQSEPMLIQEGEYHVPYVERLRDNTGFLQYTNQDGTEVYTLDEALKISASCCAQASYRALDDSLEKAIALFDRLVGGEPLHASPFEHPCTPFSRDEHDVRNEHRSQLYIDMQKFYTPDLAAKFADIVMYAGNFRGWTQYRKSLPNENLEQPFTKS